MDRTTEIFVLVVANKVASGYRRAGFSLRKGENTLEGVTAAQLAQIKSDARLAVLKVESAQNGETSSKGLPQNGKSTQTQHSLDGGVLPTDLTVEQLKTNLTELGIEFAKSAKKEELVALLDAALATKNGE